MEYHSKRFENARFTSHAGNSNCFNDLSKSVPQQKKVKRTRSKSVNKQYPSRRQLQTHLQRLVHLVPVFYACLVSCLHLIKSCLHNTIICIFCQSRSCTSPQQNECRNKTPDSADTRENPLQEGRFTPEELISKRNLTTKSSSFLFSSDSEEDSDFCPPNSLRTANQLNINGLKIDDDELPFVRVIDNLLYFGNLYFSNYSAFRQELSQSLQNWGYPSSSSPLTYGHNWNPNEKRPKLVKKGIEFLIKRKLKQKMTRCSGESHKRWVMKIAQVSRIMIFLLQFALMSLPDVFKHKNDGFKFVPEESYGKLLDPLINSTFGGYVNWDAHYFLHISVYGYTSENSLAFFPLLPMLIYIPSRILYFFLGSLVSLSSLVIVIGVFINFQLFLKCVDNIYELARSRIGSSSQLITTACMLFCFNPASVFFGGLYTETLFAYLSSSVLLHLLSREYMTSLAFAAMSTICRSNGLLNAGFILAFALQGELSRKTFRLSTFVMWSFLMVALTLLPFGMYQSYCVLAFCNNGQVYNDPQDIPRYCLGRLGLSSLPYFYIQGKYWNVGFLEYLQFKQIPNFILATPVLYILGTQSWKTLKLALVGMLTTKKYLQIYRLSHAVHGLFLTFFCLFFVHVQVSTRLIMAACPYLFVYLAEAYAVEIEQFRNREINLPTQSLGITLWCALYYVVGTIMFTLGLPWT